jgi:hypothetical protein
MAAANWGGGRAYHEKFDGKIGVEQSERAWATCSGGKRRAR